MEEYFKRGVEVKAFSGPLIEFVCNRFSPPLNNATISASRKRVLGGLYRRICARERKLRVTFVNY
jgi:hypothetical protein